MKTENIFTCIPPTLAKELFTNLLSAENIRIERIVSEGHCSPEGFWYDQDRHEWVIVLEGSAAIQFEGQAQAVELHRGDYLNIPAHIKHRVARTSSTEKTIWLAVHYRE